MNAVRRAIELVCVLSGLSLVSTLFGFVRFGVALQAATVILLAGTCMVLADRSETRP